MPRPTRYRIEKRLARPRQEAAPNAPPTMVDISKLPDREELDPEMPFEQVWYEHPCIRPYVYLWTDPETKKHYLRLRNGLPHEYQGVARDILRKYKPRQRVTAEMNELQEALP